MRIKYYTPEEIHEGKDRIVAVNMYTKTYDVQKPQIIKITAKQMQTRWGQYNFSTFGKLEGYGTAHFLEEDVEAAVKAYVEHHIRLQESKIRYAHERIEELKALKRTEAGDNRWN